MGSVGDAYDNAMCKTFCATLECELLDRRRIGAQAEARMAVFDFIGGRYHRTRRHSARGYRSPINTGTTAKVAIRSNFATQEMNCRVR
jgi:putative transposase